MAKELSQADIDNWKALVFDSIKRMFNETGEYRPMANILELNGESTVVSIPDLGRNDQSKDAGAFLLRTFASKHNVVAFILAQEVWLTMREAKNVKGGAQTYENYGGRPSEAPDRVEILMISCETHSKTISEFWEIKRDKQKPYLERYAPLAENEKMELSGRFANILHKPSKMN